MAIDLGDDPGGTPPSPAEKLQIRSAIGVGTTDSPTFLGVSTTTGGVLTSGSIEAGNGAVIGGANLITVRTTNGTAALFRAFQASRENWTFGISAASSSFDFLAAGTLRAQLTNTGNFSATSSLSAPVLTLTGQSLTGTQATSLVDMAATWNTTGTPSALKLNVTNTASNAAAKLIELQVGGTNMLSQTIAGLLKVGGSGFSNAYGIITEGGLSVGSGGSFTSGNQINVFAGGANVASMASAGFITISTGAFSWGSSTTVASPDLYLLRDAAGTLAQRNGTTAQAFRVANSVGASPLVDYDRGVFDFKTTTNTLRIGTENGGTYTTARPIDFVTGGVVRVSISAGGALSVIAAISSNSSITAGGTLSVGGSSVVLKDAGSLVLQFLNSGQTAGVVLDAATDGVAKFRLRGNAAFATIQGKLTTDTAYTATIVAATGYITLYDSTGTAYRVPCAV
jgi:hypothetical protein